jgi:hypothetical protein
VNKATLKIKIYSKDGGTLPSDTSDVAEMLSSHVTHVANLCVDGYHSGEIFDEEAGFKGWWEIDVS